MTVGINVQAVLPFAGNDLADTFPVAFPTFEAINVQALVSLDETEVETDLVLGTDFTLSNIGRPGQDAIFKLKDAADVPVDWVGPIPESQEWLVGGKLKTGYTLFVRFSDEAFQPQKFRGFGSLTPEQIENVVDRFTMNIKSLRADVERSLKYSQAAFQAGEDSDAGALVDRITKLEDDLEAFLESGAGLPPGAIDGGFLEGDTMVDAQAVWKEGAFNGISQLTGGLFVSTGLYDTLAKIIRIQYTPPTISLSASPGQGIREKGTVVSSVALAATYVKKSNDIASVRFYGAGLLIDTIASPTPGGGVGNFTSNTPFSDNMSFQAQVTDVAVGADGPSTASSNTVNFPFVYPYYHGCEDPGFPSAAMTGLFTKSLIQSTASVNKSFTAINGNVFYFMYPASYGALTSIKDPNNFETIGDWTLRTENVAMLNGTSQSYRIYEFNNPVVAGTTAYTFTR